MVCALPEDIIFLTERPLFPWGFKPCEYTELRHFETYFGQFINTVGLDGLWKFAQRKPLTAEPKADCECNNS